MRRILKKLSTLFLTFVISTMPAWSWERTIRTFWSVRRCLQITQHALRESGQELKVYRISHEIRP